MGRAREGWLGIGALRPAPEIAPQALAIIEKGEDYFIMAKDMEDDSKALGLFNTAEIQTEVTVTWNDLRIDGAQRVRDLWRQKDLGTYKNQFKAKVPRHGVVFVRLFSK